MSSHITQKLRPYQNNKKKPPPRPPPPNFSKYKSKSTYNLNQNNENSFSLIEWSPPSSPKVERSRPFGGSVSSSFSSSTSSLASSKKSFELDPMPPTNALWSNNNSHFYQSNVSQTTNPKSTTLNMPPLFGPTIIRPQAQKKNNLSSRTASPENFSTSPLPMPSVPPPSPPKEVSNVVTPYGIALYDFPASYPSDLPLQVDDVVILLRRINSEWLYGRVLDKEGMFPVNFVDIQVALPEDEKTVTALYEFCPQMPGDLEIKPGESINVIKKISADWLYGELNGKFGQFPSNFVDRIPNNL